MEDLIERQAVLDSIFAHESLDGNDAIVWIG